MAGLRSSSKFYSVANLRFYSRETIQGLLLDRECRDWELPFGSRICELTAYMPVLKLPSRSCQNFQLCQLFAFEVWSWPKSCYSKSRPWLLNAGFEKINPLTPCNWS